VVVNDDGLALRGAKHNLGLLNVGLTRTVRAETGEVNPGNRAHAPKPGNHDRRAVDHCAASWIERSAIDYLPGSGAATARHDRWSARNQAAVDWLVSLWNPMHSRGDLLHYGTFPASPSATSPHAQNS
jgi:hypothetical protein